MAKISERNNSSIGLLIFPVLLILLAFSTNAQKKGVVNQIPSDSINSGKPLELLNFSVKCDNQKVNINFTATLQNTVSLTIQKSTDGTNFSNLEFFNTSKMGDGNHSFSVSDNVVNGYNKFYRIKQMQIDGGISFSKVISKTCFTNLFVCFYDASSQLLKVQFSQLIQNGHIDFYNFSGKKIFEKDIHNKAYAQINAADLSNGIYFISVYSDEFSDGKKVQLLK